MTIHTSYQVYAMLLQLCKVLPMTSTGQKAWETKVSNAICDVPLTYVLCLLQMKLLDNVIRAHLQVAI